MVSRREAAVRSPVLRVRNVAWRASTVPVLEHVSFDVAPGELVAVMGRNGAGKSTLLDIIAGLRSPTEGAVILAERPLDEWAAIARARMLAHLPQSLRADLSMRAEALVLMGRYAHAARWFESDEDRQVAQEAMQRCECLEFRRRTLATLSGGERQRVFLAACLAQQGRVLLLDEPATFLDVDQQLQCFSVLRAEAERGTACLVVTHDVNLALTFCTRVIILAERGVARDLATESALDDPAWLHVFSQRLTVDQGASRPWVRYE
ncbi:MAG: ATP-binding cassette domain-containing protein [Luteitalea sp.]|nr:ATP-binding cassette domain-containing protein [Luteitalea sp.]